MASSAEHLLARLADAVTSPKTLRLVLTSFLAASVLLFALVSSSVASLAFYNILIPPDSLATPVFLQYGSGIPTAKLTLPATVRSSQYYNVRLELEAPASRRNIDLGNFMVSIALRSQSNSLVDYSSRPTSLEEEPLLYSLMREILSMRRTQKLQVSLFDRLQPRDATSLELSVGRPGAELHVYRSTLVFDAYLTGYKYLMHQHRIITFIVLSSTFFFWEFLSALVGWSLIFRRRPQQQTAPIADRPAVERKPTQEELRKAIQKANAEDAEEAKHENIRRRRGGIPFDPLSHTSVIDATLAKQIGDIGQHPEDNASNLFSPNRPDADHAESESDDLTPESDVKAPSRNEEIEVKEEAKEEDDASLLGGSETSKETEQSTSQAQTSTTEGSTRDGSG